MAERRLLQTNIALLESDIESAKKEWGLASWDAMAAGNEEAVRFNFLRTKTLVEELQGQIAEAQRQIADLDAGPSIVETPEGTTVVQLPQEEPGPATPPARPPQRLQMPTEEEEVVAEEELAPISPDNRGSIPPRNPEEMPAAVVAAQVVVEGVEEEEAVVAAPAPTAAAATTPKPPAAAKTESELNAELDAELDEALAKEIN